MRNNAIFGKSMEDPMNKVDVKLVAIRKQYLKWSFRATAIEKEECRINLHKRIYVRTSILDLRKALM